MANEPIESLLVKLQVDSSALSKGLNQAQVDIDKLKRKFHDTGPEIGLIQKAMNSLGGSMSALAAGAVGFGALANGIKSVVGTAADFEQKMSKVRALTGGTEADFNRLREAAIKLGSATVFSASEASDGMATLAAAGMSTNEVLAAMPALLAGAAAAGGDFNATANTLVGTLGGFGLAATDSAHVMDVLAAAANASRMNITDMGDVFKFTASSAAAYGVSLEQVAAAAVLMNNAGLEAGQTGHYLNQVFQRLAKPTDEAAEMMKKLGLDFFDAQGKFIGLVPLVDQLKTKLGSLTVEQRQNALATVFGTEATNAMLKLMAAGGPAIEKVTEQLRKSDGAAQKMAETMTDNLSGAIEQTKGALESLAITIGSTSLKGLKGATDATTDLINETGHLANEALPLLDAAINKTGAAFGINFTQKIRDAANTIQLLVAGLMALNALREGNASKMAEALATGVGAGVDLGMVEAPDPLGILHHAKGAITRGPELALIGESGSEAVVPLAGNPFKNLASLLGVRTMATGGVAGDWAGYEDMMGGPGGSTADQLAHWLEVQKMIEALTKGGNEATKALSDWAKVVEKSAKNEVEGKGGAGGGMLTGPPVSAQAQTIGQVIAGDLVKGLEAWNKANPLHVDMSKMSTELAKVVSGLGTGTKSTNKDEGKTWTTADLMDLSQLATGSGYGKGGWQSYQSQMGGNIGADPVAGRIVGSEIGKAMLEEWKNLQFGGAGSDLAGNEGGIDVARAMLEGWKSGQFQGSEGSMADPVAGRNPAGDLAMQMLEDWKAGQFGGGEGGGKSININEDVLQPMNDALAAMAAAAQANRDAVMGGGYQGHGTGEVTWTDAAATGLADAFTSAMGGTFERLATGIEEIKNISFGQLGGAVMTGNLDFKAMFPNLDAEMAKGIQQLMQKQIAFNDGMVLRTHGQLMNMLNSQLDEAKWLGAMDAIAGGTNVAKQAFDDLTTSIFAGNEQMSHAGAINDIWAAAHQAEADAMLLVTGSLSQSAAEIAGAGAAFHSVGMSMSGGTMLGGAASHTPFFGPALSPGTIAAVNGSGGAAGPGGTSSAPFFNPGAVPGTAQRMQPTGVYLDGKRVGDALNETVSVGMRGTFTGGWRV